MRKIMYTPINPSFTIYKWGYKGSTLYRYVFVRSVDPNQTPHSAVSDLGLHCLLTHFCQYCWMGGKQFSALSDLGLHSW